MNMATGITLTILLTNVIFGFITAKVASEKGHSETGWFFIGLAIGIIGLAIICTADDKRVWIPSDKEEEASWLKSPPPPRERTKN